LLWGVMGPDAVNDVAPQKPPHGRGDFECRVGVEGGRVETTRKDNGTRIDTSP